MSQQRWWKCEVCGYVHRGEAPPDRCPVCGVSNELFSLLEIPPAAPTPPTAAGEWRCTICDYVAEGDRPPVVCPVCGAEANLFEPHEALPEAPKSTGGARRIVVLGGGIAGLTAAEQARHVAADASVTLVAKEPGLPYLRLNLTRLLAGEVPADSMVLQPSSWFDEQRIELVHDSGATAIDREARAIVLGSGRRVSYDRLVLATGAHPFVPPIPGATRAGVHPLRTLDDVHGIQQRTAAPGPCVCIGGGILGLEAAGALLRRGMAVTVLEGFDTLLPRQLAPPGGRLLARQIEQLGIAVRCGVRVDAIAGDEEVRAVVLDDGVEFDAGLVILSTGVRPNSYLARQSGLAVHQGVIVDDQLLTSDEAIYAAGDVAEHRGVVYGLWPHAYAQGMVAGANAAGAALEFHGLPPSNQIKALDVKLFSIGQFMPSDGSYGCFEQQTDNDYVRLVVHDGHIVGANLLGDTSLAAPLKTWVEKQTQIAELPDLLERYPGIAEACPGL